MLPGFARNFKPLEILTGEQLQAIHRGTLDVLETTGVRAAQAAGMNVIAIATPFTNASLHSEQLIDDTWIVHQPEKLVETVRQLIAEHNRSAHGGESNARERQ